MGNFCGKESMEDPNAGQSQRLSSLPPNSNTRMAHGPKKFGGPPRILGSESGTASGKDSEDARKRAGEAAEARANASGKSNKKLTSQLHQQKKMTRAALLDDVSQNAMRARAMDENLEVRRYQ